MQRLTFHHLYEDHAADIHRFALWLTGNPQTAEDITAETFLRAFTAPTPVRPTTARAYLLAIARNLATDEHRRTRRHEPLAGAFPSAEPSPERRAWLTRVLDEMHRLPENYGLPLLLYAAGGLAYDEIAAQLGLPLATVKVRIHRARLLLAEALHPAPAAKETSRL